MSLPRPPSSGRCLCARASGSNRGEVEARGDNTHPLPRVLVHTHTNIYSHIHRNVHTPCSHNAQMLAFARLHIQRSHKQYTYTQLVTTHIYPQIFTFAKKLTISAQKSMHSHIHKYNHEVHSYTQKYKLIYNTHLHRQLHTHTLICLSKHTFTHKNHTLIHTLELTHAHKMDRDTHSHSTHPNTTHTNYTQIHINTHSCSHSHTHSHRQTHTRANNHTQTQ